MSGSELFDVDRRQLLGAAAKVAAVAGAASVLSTQSTQAVADDTVRSFVYEAPDDALIDLRRRLTATRWPEPETVPDDTQGVQYETMRKLVEYWRTGYDWRKIEARLNGFPQYITEIDGLDIHFIHVRSPHDDALPLIVTHGWPGSILEQIKIIEPLTNPTQYGGNAADAFHIVVPSMPGYGFSGKPTQPGWGPERIARAWIELMSRLGYTRYVAQGGDWGALITDLMGAAAPPGLIGIHTNMPGAVPPEIDAAAFVGAPPPADLPADEVPAYEQLRFFYTTGLSYALEMGKRPQTLYGIADSPAGLAAWMLDHDARSYQMIARSIDGKSEGLSPDDVLDNITLFWLTNTGVSAARLYWENKLAFFAPKNVTIPVAVSVFPDELYPAPRRWVEQAYPNLIHYNTLPRGGHFAAWEQPELFVDEVRDGFRSLRSS
jgi:pimeloyl-ACP methyl ester carboxylesterase